MHSPVASTAVEPQQNHLPIGQEQFLTLVSVTATMTYWIVVQFPPLPLFLLSQKLQICVPSSVLPSHFDRVFAGHFT